MDRCILCGVETHLYYNSQPMCPRCCDALEAEREESNAGETETATKNVLTASILEWSQPS